MNSIVPGVARAVPRVLAALALAAVAGCATTGPGTQHASGPNDPLEPFNRKMFAFNDKLDTYALKPVAKAYNNVVPSPVRTGVHNVFGNFSDAWSAVNQLLQGKIDNGARMTMRVLTNTVIGLGGILDPATPLGLERQSEDLGQTLGRWGVPPGPFLVLPLFGPSDIRDAIALPADDYVTPALLVDSTWQKVGVDAIGVIDTRAGLLGASQMLDELAFDRYTFLRDAYVARRRSLVYDGNPPDEPGTDNDGDDDKSAPVAPPSQGGMKPSAPAGAASGAGSSQADAEAKVADASPAPAPVASTPASQPGGGVSPAPLPASAPRLPVPIPGPAPVPPPPASAPHA